MTRTNARRKLCEELAASLATGQGLRQLRLSQILEQGQLEGIKAPERSQEPQPISIWRPEKKEGNLVFVRPEPGPFGDHYATRRVIQAIPGSGSKRICFFGESVAAGYLYAPHLTPAAVLEHQLNSGQTAAPFEVVDLARTNETLSSLVETVAASLQLDPQMLVLFVGNNWNLLETPQASAYAPSLKARQNYALHLREKGWEGPLEAAMKACSKKALDALDHIAQLAGSIPVVVIVPEVNLVDWTSRQPAPWLPGIGNALWYELYQQAVGFLEKEEWDRAEQAGMDMLSLDDGICPTSFSIIGEARKGSGREALAEQAFRAEVDSAAYASNCFLDAPRANTMVRRTLHFASGMHGFHTVDLKGVFGVLPDREWFVDYCHLTAKGIEKAMALTAREILDQFEVDGPAVFPDYPLAPEAEALAMFGAAIHGAHRLLAIGSKRALIRYWCERALETSPAIAAVMVQFVQARCAPCPAVMTGAQQFINQSSYALNLQHGWKYDYLDVEVIAAVEESLTNKGFAEADEVSVLLVEQLGFNRSWKELAPYYLWEPLEQAFPEIMVLNDLPSRAFYRFPWPVTGFCLIGRDALELEITLRLVHENSGQTAFSVNGKFLAMVETNAKWQTHRLVVPAYMMNQILNEITLHWPMPGIDGETGMERFTERLEMGWDADPHPIFGEIATLKARHLQ